ncbi:hypothetical protein [Burkholderia cenocepacia]|uniref:hypothetical protein n=2 Tax=Burkholderia cenocepacia TaxID=95486 RepID=UPI0002343755|nr:hypothetical protein [Burkholderia cenocepacia]MDF0501748.1 hypothetical protein [Burkholderia cenocepacia]CDN60194.1 hypothetical protein I35_1671 [Burkholderia cenocepacia H111]
MTSPARQLLRIACAAACLAFAQHAVADDDWDAARQVRTSWVFASMKESDVRPTLDRALKDQLRWARLPGNAPDDGAFRCTKLAVPPPSAAAQAAFDAAPSSRSRDADKAYAKAASLGSWRAAARLVNSSLEDEDWEGAQPAVAWLLAHQVPAGYNKLADVMQAMSGYDGETPGERVRGMIASLRWRAAREGDPVAQMEMADLFEKLGNSERVAALRACATQQNPELK